MGTYLLVSGDFVRTGGMDAANHALATFLADRGDVVHLVAYRAAPDLAERPNVRVHRVWKPAGSYLLGSGVLDRMGRLWAARIAALGGRVLVNGGNCRWGDVNWVHYLHAAYRPPMHGGMVPSAHRRLARRLALGRERRALRAARLVIANSEGTRRRLVDLLGLEPDRVRTVYYGSDPTRFAPVPPERRAATREANGLPSARPLVAFVGALGDRRKGLDVLLRAWSVLCGGGGWDADLVVIGEGAELASWKLRTRRDPGIAERVHYLGFRGDVHELLPACDALVAATRHEPYGLAVQEAMCCGIPAFVTAAAGVAERYPEEVADWLIPDPEDVDDLVRRMRAWRADLAANRNRAEAAGRTLSRRTWACMGAEIAAAIEGG